MTTSMKHGSIVHMSSFLGMRRVQEFSIDSLLPGRCESADEQAGSARSSRDLWTSPVYLPPQNQQTYSASNGFILQLLQSL